MCKYNANSGTKEGIRNQDLFFSITKKTEVIAVATVENQSEYLSNLSI